MTRKRVRSNNARLLYKAWLAPQANNMVGLMQAMAQQIMLWQVGRQTWRTLAIFGDLWQFCLVRSGAFAWHCLQPCTALMTFIPGEGMGQYLDAAEFIQQESHGSLPFAGAFCCADGAPGADLLRYVVSFLKHHSVCLNPKLTHTKCMMCRQSVILSPQL